jgi:hypothetical protein
VLKVKTSNIPPRIGHIRFVPTKDGAAVYVSVGADYKEADSMLNRMQDTRQREALDARLGIALPKSKIELEAEEAERGFSLWSK